MEGSTDNKKINTPIKTDSNSEFISLYEAGRIYGYSPAYLNILIHQKKLNAIKIGRNWVTTKKWVADYIDFKNGILPKEDYSPEPDFQVLSDEEIDKLKLARVKELKTPSSFYNFLNLPLPIIFSGVKNKFKKE